MEVVSFFTTVGGEVSEHCPQRCLQTAGVQCKCVTHPL